MGQETSLPQILAAELGVPFESITYVQGDTDATPIGGGHGGSRNLEMGGSAVVQAAREIQAKGKQDRSPSSEFDRRRYRI